MLHKQAGLLGAALGAAKFIGTKVAPRMKDFTKGIGEAKSIGEKATLVSNSASKITAPLGRYGNYKDVTDAFGNQTGTNNKNKDFVNTSIGVTGR